MKESIYIYILIVLSHVDVEFTDIMMYDDDIGVMYVIDEYRRISIDNNQRHLTSLCPEQSRSTINTGL